MTHNQLLISKSCQTWVQKIGLLTIEQLKQANPNKLFNDVCGMRKKMKLKDVKNPDLEEVKNWLD